MSLPLLKLASNNGSFMVVASQQKKLALVGKTRRITKLRADQLVFRFRRHAMMDSMVAESGMRVRDLDWIP